MYFVVAQGQLHCHDEIQLVKIGRILSRVRCFNCEAHGFPEIVSPKTARLLEQYAMHSGC